MNDVRGPLRSFVPGTKREASRLRVGCETDESSGAILRACVWLAFLARGEEVCCNLIDNDVRQSGKQSENRAIGDSPDLVILDRGREHAIGND